MQHMPAVTGIADITVPHAMLFHIHLLFAGGIILGAVLFGHWALRALPPDRLKALSLWLLLGFTALMLATVPFCLGLAIFLQ